MDARLVQVLADTQKPQEAPRKQAEIELLHAQRNPEYPLALTRIGLSNQVPIEIRQASLSALRRFIERNWQPEGGDVNHIPISDETKEYLKTTVLNLAIAPEDDRKVKVTASLLISKIAVADFPDNWPNLLPTVLGIMPTGNDAQLHGALRILQDLVQEAITDEQFFGLARNIIAACYEVALNANRKDQHRALAVAVLRACFDLMEIVKDDHKKEVKAFADEVLAGWLPFFEEVIRSPLPEAEGADTQPQGWYGPVALKIQVLKTLIKIKSVFGSLLLPQSPTFFTVTWQELKRLGPVYEALYVTSDSQSRLEDTDGLPYSVDVLVLDELDFLNQCMRASPVAKSLEAEIATHGSVHNTPWVLELMEILVRYGQISQEEEGLWEFDVSLYLAEETSVSSNYTARTACGDLLIKMGEWMGENAFIGLYAFTKTLFQGEKLSWQKQEAALFLFISLFNDFYDLEKNIPLEMSHAWLELINYAIGRQDQPMLRARGYLVAGALARTFEPALPLLDAVIAAMNQDQSELVQVACVKAVEGFIIGGAPLQAQVPIIVAIQQFLESKDVNDLEDAEDLLVTLLETLRAAFNMDYRIVLSPESKALDLVFLVIKHGAANLQIDGLVNDIFYELAERIQEIGEPALYTALCAKALPPITSTFDVANLTQDEPLVTIATEILSVILHFGAEPLPAGLVASVLPKVNHLLMNSDEAEVLRPAAEAVKDMLQHDHQQVFSYQDESGRSGLEVCLHIIDRLLGQNLEDNAAAEVGGVAAALVEKAGQERLGPFLQQLLQAVAQRLDSAQNVGLIQSLILVFARLSEVGAQDVVEFLSSITINGQSGLQVVLSKWLENSVNFVGFEETTRNIIALSKVYALNDPRVAQVQVKGELIITETKRIRTRSQTKLQPDQFTIIPAPLKILKLLVDDLVFAAGAQPASKVAAVAASQFADVDSDDGSEGWEDETNDLVNLAAGGNFDFGDRTRNDETGEYLREFFVKAAQENTGNFQHWFELLNDDEKGKLRELAQ
ncbi:putative importin beta subunit [Triangularia verruculosa]|uniref:Importin beta subunit n=1 Tax=Triangularia verruculosa TaxID=2587418 RepID=A0AAN6XGW1_9PEZI|nr:putative importin beta subunit [Triangularia verruculosa]